MPTKFYDARRLSRPQPARDESVGLPASPDVSDVECGGLDWLNDERVAKRIAKQHGECVTKLPHAITGRFAIGPARVCEAWDTWTRKVRALLPLEARVRLRRCGPSPTW